MPSKRTNDSVDAILQELDHRQTAATVQGSVADRQVDDILRSVGVLKDDAPVEQFGPVDASVLPTADLIGAGLPVAADRFSTAALDDILADLPSMRGASAAAARPAAPQPAPARNVYTPAPARQPAPAQKPMQPAAPVQRTVSQSAPEQRPVQRPVQQAAPVQRTVSQPAPEQRPEQRPVQPAAPVQRTVSQPAPVQKPVQQAAPQPAPVQKPVQQAAPEQKPAPQPDTTRPAAPARPEIVDTATGDTTRTSIIKGFLRKMGGEDADQSALNQGKSQFQHFFAESAAVLPDEKGRLQNPAKKKRGLFGLGRVEDTDEFVPINVSLSASHPEESDAYGTRMAEDAPKKRGLLARLFGGREQSEEELYIPESREETVPAAPQGGIRFDDTADELPPIADEPRREATMQLPRGSIRSKYTAGPGAGLDDLQSAAPAPAPAQAPIEDLYGSAGVPAQVEERFAGRHGSAPARVPEPAGDELAGLYGFTDVPADATAEIDFASYTPTAKPFVDTPSGDTTLNFLRAMDAVRAAGRKQAPAPGTAPDPETVKALAAASAQEPARAAGSAPASARTPAPAAPAAPARSAAPAQASAPAAPAQGSTVYHRAGSKPARRRFAAPQPAPRPAPEPTYRKEPTEPLPETSGTGPVGEPLMTTHDDLPAVDLLFGSESQAAKAAPAPVYETPAPAPAYGEQPVYTPAPAAAAPVPEASTGFTVQMDLGGAREDTAMFLSAYGQARERRRPRAAAPAPESTVPADEPPTLEPIDERPTVERLPAQKAAPAAPVSDDTRTATGVVKLGEVMPAGNVAEQAVSAARAAAQPSDFVRNIAQSINDQTLARPSIRLGDTAGTRAGRGEEYYRQAAEVLTDTNSEVPPAVRAGTAPRLDGTPADEVQETATMPPFTAAPRPTRHAYDKPDDAPAVRRDLERQVLQLTVSAIISGVLAVVLLLLGTAALSGGWLPAALDVQAGRTPLLVVQLVLLLAAMGVCWRTVYEGAVGLFRSPSPDTMPTLAALGALVQLVVLLAHDAWYDPAKFGLVAGLAALVLCLNTVGKALDAKTLLGGFDLVSAKVEHAVAYRLKDSSMLRAATRGLAEGRPCVLVSRPTELFKGFLNNASAHRTSDKNQQQFAWALGVCALLALAFNLAYHRDVGLAVSAFAAVLCIGAPLAGTLISALPARFMQRSAARIGAVIPGWRDIRLLGRVNVIRVTARDLFPDGCVKLCGIKPVRREDIDRAIIYAASMLADGCQTLQGVFLGMIGDNRKLLAKVDDFTAEYGRGYVGWIGGERVLLGNRALMEQYEIGLPSLEYEQKHTVNQRRVIYLAVAGKLFSMFQVAYQRDDDTAYVLDSLRRTGISIIVDGEDFNCDAMLLEAVYGLTAGTAKVLSAEERTTLEPATAWLPESEGSMLHLGSFASFVGGLEAAAGAAAGEHWASMFLTGGVMFSCVLGLVLAITGGIVSLPLPALVLYQAAWAVLALIFPLLQHY